MMSQMFQGNPAMERAVAPEMLVHKGPARVFESEEDCEKVCRELATGEGIRQCLTLNVPSWFKRFLMV